MGKENRSVYIISRKTKAIIYKPSNYYRALILEENNIERFSIHKPEQIIDHSCLIYGSTLDGRIAPVKDILKSASKLPVPISREKSIFMIPTASVKNKACAWVAYHHIDDYEQRDDKTFIAFHDGTGIYVNTSLSSFDNQYKRASQVIVHVNRGLIFGGGAHNWW